MLIGTSENKEIDDYDQNLFNSHTMEKPRQRDDRAKQN